jgi:hypothetical protein
MLLAILRSPAAQAPALFGPDPDGAWTRLLADDTVREFLGVNEFEGVRYFSKESFEELVDWLFGLSALGGPGADPTASGPALEAAFRRRNEILELSHRCAYRLDLLVRKLAGR